MIQQLYNRDDAARYLSQIGLRVSKVTLARMAMEGSGPPYSLIRGGAYYTQDALDTWVTQNLVERSHSLQHMLAGEKA